MREKTKNKPENPKHIGERLLPHMPAMFWLSLHIARINFYIPELGLNIDRYRFYTYLVALYIAYKVIIIDRFKNSNLPYGPTVTIYLFPIEFAMFIVFSQYHIIISVILLCACAIVSLLFYLLTKYIEKNRVRPIENGINPKKTTYKKLRLILSLTGYNMILLPAALVALFYLFTNAPLAKPSVSAANIPVFDENDTGRIWNDERVAKIAALNEDKWQTLNCDEKIDILQTLVNYETTYMKIDAVKVAGSKLDPQVLGEYYCDDNAIYIDYVQLESADAAECIKTICHEVRHSYQYFTVDMIDWENEYVQSAFFYDEVRSWKNEMDNHTDWETDYWGYYFQAIEIDARSYSNQRSEFYTHLIENYTN